MNEPMDLSGVLVAWNGCRIRLDLLDRVRAAFSAADPRHVTDLSHSLEKALRGKDVLKVEQIPARLRNALKL